MNKTMKSNFLVRTLSGVVLFGVVLGAAFWSEYSFLALLLVIYAGAANEFYRMAKRAGAEPLRVYGVVAGAGVLILNFFAAQSGANHNVIGGGISDGGVIGVLPQVSVEAGNMILFSILAMFLPFIIELYRNRANPIFNIGATIMGVVYTAVPLSLFIHIAISMPTGGYSAWWVLWYFFIVWANDVGAYIVGVSIGKHRLFERISPKKSWEGFFGGVVMAIGIGVLAGHMLGESVCFWGGVGAVISTSGVLGDLVESMFKRSVGVKDSGKIMPGHGGFLDRFDSLLVSLPLVFCYFVLFYNLI